MVKLSSVDRARDRARVIGHLEAGWKQRDVAVLLGVSHSTLSKLRLRYRDTHDVKDMPTSGRPRITTDRVESGSFNWPGEFDESSHHCTQPTDALFRTSWQAGVCTDHQEPATCFTVEIPESCPEASPNSWSNNWVHWPVLNVAHYCHWEILANFCWTPPLFSGLYISLWSG